MYTCKAIKIEFPLKDGEVRYLRTYGEKQLSWATLKDKLTEQFAELLPNDFSILLHVNGAMKHV